MNGEPTTCGICGGSAKILRIDHCFKKPSGFQIFQNVLTIVCQEDECGKSLFDSATLKRMETAVHCEPTYFKMVPVYRL